MLLFQNLKQHWQLCFACFLGVGYASKNHIVIDYPDSNHNQIPAHLEFSVEKIQHTYFQISALFHYHFNAWFNSMRLVLHSGMTVMTLNLVSWQNDSAQ